MQAFLKRAGFFEACKLWHTGYRSKKKDFLSALQSVPAKQANGIQNEKESERFTPDREGSRRAEAGSA